jgi:hypothetical protein
LSYDIAMFRPLRARSAIFLLLTICVVVGAINATLMYDNPFLYELFQNMTATYSPVAVARFLFLGLDLGGAQYRLYGLSKVLQYALWLAVGVSPWIYGAVIGGTQAVSGLIVFDVFQRWGADRLQAMLLGLTWALSPFAVTAVFHHYSYLILPYQLAFVCVAIIQHGQDSRRWVWRAAAAVVAVCLSLTGEADIPAALTLLCFAAMIAPKGYPLSSRFLDFFIPTAVIIAVAVTHYWVWTRLTSGYQGPTRFHPTLLTFSQLAEIGPRFVSTLFQGLMLQVQAIVSFAGGWAIAALIPAAIVVFVALYEKNAAVFGGSEGRRSGRLSIPACRGCMGIRLCPSRTWRSLCCGSCQTRRGRHRSIVCSQHVVAGLPVGKKRQHEYGTYHRDQGAFPQRDASLRQLSSIGAGGRI